MGPEVVARAARDARLPRGVSLAFFGSAPLLLEGARRARVFARPVPAGVTLGRGQRSRTVSCLLPAADDLGLAVGPGEVSPGALESQRDALVRACAAAQRGEIQAIVTGPVRKRALVVGGRAFPGQTELVHHYLHVDDDPPLMVFAGGPFVLGLATVHVPLGEAPRNVTPRGLDVALTRLREAARHIRGLRREPRMVVLGVNPHAGEGGLLGAEEQEVVAPAVGRARARGLRVEGPVAADGFFADLARGAKPPDAVLAMHHDQGLGPYKLLAAGAGINVTWGLTVPRTSPDHGTADALAGTGRADAGSFRHALELAALLARRTQRPARRS